ncbi:hypothetical protein [Streptomyces sp. bgisy100]|uniref:hypothetical protein n=1 Tax=Streptomyces sp. bgisy100 TaxID=3413783 RepID=UPI003D744270
MKKTAKEIGDVTLRRGSPTTPWGWPLYPRLVPARRTHRSVPRRRSWNAIWDEIIQALGTDWDGYTFVSSVGWAA